MMSQLKHSLVHNRLEVDFICAIYVGWSVSKSILVWNLGMYSEDIFVV